MSLLDEYMEACTFLTRSIVSDGYDGYVEEYTDGIEFQAAIVQDSSIQAKIAQKQGVTELYTITTRKALNLQFHDVFRRNSTGETFRVTSNGNDKHTPASAGLNMRQVSAEKYSLPKGASE